MPRPSQAVTQRLANGNVAKESASFYEWYGKATYTVNDQWAFGLQEWYSPSVANTGSVGWFTTGNAHLHRAEHLVYQRLGWLCVG